MRCNDVCRGISASSRFGSGSVFRSLDLVRGFITDGDALDMEVHRFRILYNTIRPHHALGDQIPKAACLQLDRGENAR